jgi:hypothetical protein
MAARLGNVIYWACCGIAALWLVACAAVVLSERRTTFEFRSANDRMSPYTITLSGGTTPEYALTALQRGVRYNAADSEWRRQHGLQPWANGFDPDRFLIERMKLSDDPNHWRVMQQSSPPWAELLFAILALPMWLFGRACRYVLAGT